ncbi:MAG: 2-amino-4-hydroxy-6-hydroxymethyldihydropteridine diphosphokinase [Selenomonadaceae bacterium]|nr:2-amino-4-hydroxy-6-hydroxymethyldihydropteridine diphosphokinase [Selenomonadaceae bacterium]
MIYFVGLGGNLGQRELTLRRAVERVKNLPNVKLLRVSSFYETQPWGVTNQPNFINAAIKISSELEPLALLDELQRIELDFGRVRLQRWGARTLDLDILLAEREISCERLTVPHPLLFERDFALVPLKEICPSLECKFHGDKISRVKASPVDFKFKLVACVDKNFGLGLNGQLLFKIPADLKRFRELTLDGTIIFGRRTLATFPNQRPLDRRRNIILSTSLEEISGAQIVGSVEELFDALDVAEENFVIGGAQVFDELIPYAAEIFLTVVDAETQADAFFPPVDEFTLRDAEICDGIAFRRYTR